jgi:ribosomal protein S18 acetylase RimI-like enzyme
MPEIFTFRPPTFDDLDAVVRLICRYDESITGEPESYADEVRAVRLDWEDDAVDLEQDSRLVFDSTGELVGYLIVYRGSSEDAPGVIDFYVDPVVQESTLGRQLLAEGEARLLTMLPKRAEALSSCYLHDEVSNQLLRMANYNLERYFWRMVIDTAQAPQAEALPDGIQLRPFDPERHAEAVYEAFEEAFADHWEHHRDPFEVWRHYLLDRDDFDPRLWLIAYAGDEIAGFALCFPREEMGWVRALGVRRPWRRRGLARALLIEAFAVFKQRGAAKVGLGVDAASPTGATHLYTQVGMQIEQQYTTYRKVLREV